MSTPGINDPNWYEWYVGLKYVIEMINPDSNIEYVIFQHEDYDTIDDVVVQYKNGDKQLCYQVKHQISTSKMNNLTFGKLLEKSKNNKSLLESIFYGWKDAVHNNVGKSIVPILFTNRCTTGRTSKRCYNGNEYKAYSIREFLRLIKNVFHDELNPLNYHIEDKNLLLQWKELCDKLNIQDEKEIINFIKCMDIRSDQKNLDDLEKELIDSLSNILNCRYAIANDLFNKLIRGLSKWTTTRRETQNIGIEEVYHFIGKEDDINEAQHRLIPPLPFFESRKIFCDDLRNKIISTDKKVIFISGDPGSGKTSLISYLQSEFNFFLLRYHTFKPISPKQHFYNLDEGMCSEENLWGTFLIQLRQKFDGELAKYKVPINNNLLTTEEIRDNVCRLLGILGKRAICKNEKVYVCIDGIDHAARAKNKCSFLASLFYPENIPEGVCFVIVGQPRKLYEEEYPIWLSNSKLVETISLPKLNVSDIKQLIISYAPQFVNELDGISNLIFEKTEGNNLSTIFAIKEIEMLDTVEDIIEKFKIRNITSNLEQYYSNIWKYMKDKIRNMGIDKCFLEITMASFILLMNGRINTRILSKALKSDINETDWSLILDSLNPLIIKCDSLNEYSLYHNDFRIFLMRIINDYEVKYKETALLLSKYLLDNDEGILSYALPIDLLKCADRKDLIPNYFTPGFVINALAEGVSKNRLDSYAHISYEQSIINKDKKGYENTFLSIKTLYQHERYYEYYQRDYVTKDDFDNYMIDINEIRSLPLELKNIDEYQKVLNLCIELYQNVE